MPKVEPHSRSRIFSMAAALDGGFGGGCDREPVPVPPSSRVCDDARSMTCQQPSRLKHRFLGQSAGKV